MKKQFLEAGKIVGTHGVRGEMRADPWCDSPEFLARFKTLYLSEGKEPVSVKSRPHKNIVLIKAEGVDSIEAAELLRGKILYINRDDVRLPKGKNFIQDLIGCRVLDADDNSVEYGVIKDVFKTGANDVYTVKNSEGKEFLVPVIDSVITEKNVDEGYVLLRPIEGLFDEN
ncbi:MAG: ribosome maturation factor RimM [Ruminococcus sp.]|jgi:16S rRNA processing protein RimM|nr:ribosome maturation factor RimM [Ruminococcus sp.]